MLRLGPSDPYVRMELTKRFRTLFGDSDLSLDREEEEKSCAMGGARGNFWLVFAS
jgi:hypothetical protein